MIKSSRNRGAMRVPIEEQPEYPATRTSQTQVLVKIEFKFHTLDQKVVFSSEIYILRFSFFCAMVWVVALCVMV